MNFVSAKVIVLNVSIEFPAEEEAAEVRGEEEMEEEEEEAEDELDGGGAKTTWKRGW